MHAVKVGWVGQTFALAKSNESGGKKSRIRRSKEDRKAMVESFIKRYQISNKGSFPSLNLTHKEVGGSFYTVRELVREIIQENRVLGPAKPVEGEQDVDQFYEQYRPGSISIECESHVSLPSSEMHATSSDDYNITLNGKVSDQKLQIPDSEQYINCVLVDEKSKEADASKPLVQVKYAMLPTDIEINQNSGSMEDIVKICTPRLTPLAADVVVETFPINSTSKITQDVDGRPVEAGESAVSLEQQEIRRVEVKPELSESGVLGAKSLEHLGDQPGDQNHYTDLKDDLVLNTIHQDLVVAEKEIRNLEQQEIRRVEVKPELSESGVLGEKSLEHLSDQQGDQNHHTDMKYDLVLNTMDQDLVVAEKETKSAPEDIHSMKSDHTGRNQGESLSQGAAPIKSKNDNQNAFSREEGKTSTLNRTKLESWEGPARKSGEAETNSVVAAFKAFISAFVKFWTE